MDNSHNSGSFFILTTCQLRSLESVRELHEME